MCGKNITEFYEIFFFAKQKQKKKEKSGRNEELKIRLPVPGFISLSPHLHALFLTLCHGVQCYIPLIHDTKRTAVPGSLLEVKIQFWSPQHQPIRKHVSAENQVQIPEPFELGLVFEHGLYGFDVLSWACQCQDL